MLGFNDKVAEVEERSSERMNFRTKPRIKQAIQRAAALSGVDDSVFTMNAAYQAATQTIAARMGGSGVSVMGWKWPPNSTIASRAWLAG
jgi:hypothetical protein